MATVLGANTLSSGGFQVNNSVRFNSADSADLRISDYSGAGTSRRIRTYSMWIKRSELSYAVIFGSAGKDHWVFNANNTIQFNIGSGTDSRRVTDMRFRDTSAWYHLVFAYDTTQGTAANRFTMWVNGAVATTSIVSGKNDVQQNEDALVFINGDTHTIGSDEDSASYCDCYMAEWVFVDGQKLDADSFGEYDEDSGIWKPIDVSGITLGTNGFYLDFQTASDLGIDAGNDNDFEPTNLAAIDQTTDTCTNNFATMNPLDNYWQATAFTEGNCKLVYTSGNRTWNTASVALSSGKWYVEILKGATEHDTIGIHYKLAGALVDRPDSDAGAWSYLGGKDYDDGGVKENGSTINYAVAPSDSGDIVGMYLDLDNNKLYFAVNGAIGKINASDSGHTGIAIPAASTLENGHYYIFGGSDNASATMTHSWNFGNPIVALSSAVSDANGFGSFEYTPSGTFDGASKDFLAICSKNLAENS